MNTKWNALGFTPGLVGGHCIGVDPYYFIYKAERLGYHSQIILSGRKINDDMGNFIADVTIKNLIKTNKLIRNAKIYIMGITFKENCPDIRNSKVEDIIKKLKEYQIDVKIVDPVADEEEVRNTYQISVTKLEDVKEADCILFAVSHSQFKALSLQEVNAMFRDMPSEEKVIIDVKSIFVKQEMDTMGYTYWSL
jgi:UDP-N-acetyl-D-galactosamine dehydrogenase